MVCLCVALHCMIDMVLIDTGIFWIEFSDLLEYFSAVFMNWNPELFNYRIAQHWSWPGDSEGPRNDSYNLGYNPQFLLDVDFEAAAAVSAKSRSADDDADFDSVSGKHIRNVRGFVWILLSKHMQSTKREEQSKDDFLTLHVFGEDSKQASIIDRRVFHRNDCTMVGTYINSPHYLVRLDVNSHGGDGKSKTKRRSKKDLYTIVVSQYEKRHDVSFTMTCYSTIPCRFRPVNDSFFWKYKRKINAAFTEKYSGGCRNFASFPMNPQFRLIVNYTTRLRIMVEAPPKFNINIQLYKLCFLLLYDRPFEFKSNTCCSFLVLSTIWSTACVCNHS